MVKRLANFNRSGDVLNESRNAWQLAVYQVYSSGKKSSNIFLCHLINCSNHLHIKKNIGILRMTGEVTDRFNGITLFGMAYFGKKQWNTLQNLSSIFSHIQ